MISAVRANLNPWRKMAKMEAGGHGLYHMMGSSLPVWKVSKKMADPPEEMPRPKSEDLVTGKGFETQGPRTWVIELQCPHCPWRWESSYCLTNS